MLLKNQKLLSGHKTIIKDIEVLNLRLTSDINSSQVRLNDMDDNVQFPLFIFNRENKEALRYTTITNINTKEHDFFIELMQLVDKYNLDIEMMIKTFKIIP
jgi:hypothetical protein